MNMLRQLDLDPSTKSKCLLFLQSRQCSAGESMMKQSMIDRNRDFKEAKTRFDCVQDAKKTLMQFCDQSGEEEVNKVEKK